VFIFIYQSDATIEQLQQKIDEQKGITFSPSINKKSRDLNRNVDNLFLWDEVRKLK
jgi:hypothetical protein